MHDHEQRIQAIERKLGLRAPQTSLADLQAQEDAHRRAVADAASAKVARAREAEEARALAEQEHREAARKKAADAERKRLPQEIDAAKRLVAQLDGLGQDTTEARKRLAALQAVLEEDQKQPQPAAGSDTK